MLKLSKKVMFNLVLTSVILGTFAYGHATGITGDLNSDGIIDSTDAALMQRYILGNSDKEDINIENADINGDGNVSSIDYSLLKRYILGVIDNFDEYNESEEDESNTEDEIMINYDSLYVQNLPDYPVKIVNTNSELVEAIGSYDQYSFRGAPDIGLYVNRYSDEFFEDNSLIYVAQEKNSTYEQDTPKSIEIRDEICTVNIHRFKSKSSLSSRTDHKVFLLPISGKLNNISEAKLNIITEEEVESSHELFKTQTAVDEYPTIQNINTNAELLELFKENKSEDINEALDKYTDAYFENNGLIFIALEETSGSIWHEMDKVTFKNDECIVNLKRFTPFKGTTDMAHWALLVTVPKGIADETQEINLNIIERQDLIKDYEISMGGSGGSYSSNIERIYSRLGYTDEFFEENGMIVVSYQFGEGGNSVGLNGAAIKGDSFVISTSVNNPSFVGPPVMEYFYIYITVDKDALDSTSNLMLGPLDDKNIREIPLFIE
ncbi:dockerin type I repeat-containing protein [Herbivorax sp. ANBcel31]|uniref:dockerin type I repeat-containing protein n=1 Tax=Herbivorax sp. ANBcel31 TaxID=3069754 RepID=UPI0027B7B9CE|nr:dockerin type I repeat-containing protein [Herbivorax sp. ANBcel31]MDQ2087066.1 dockerin type I repeat-containing protein [Herbivorax sp. ANBcel31]